MHLQTLAKTAGITTAKAERFLLELANLHPSESAVERLLKRYPEFFPDLDNPKTVALIRKEPYWRLVRDVEQQLHLDAKKSPKVAFVFFFSYYLLGDRIWAVSEPWTAAWNIFASLLLYKNVLPDTADDPLGPPPWTPFTASMFYLWLNIERTRRCKNPSCKVTPYFFARKKGQEYCGDLCAAEAQREYKRKWWAERGSQWRKERKK